MKYAFTHERVDDRRPTYLHQMPRPNESFSFPIKLYATLNLNINGTGTAWHIYNPSLEEHLRHNGYFPTEASRWLYTHLKSSIKAAHCCRNRRSPNNGKTWSMHWRVQYGLNKNYKRKDMGVLTKLLPRTVTKRYQLWVHFSRPALLQQTLELLNWAEVNQTWSPLAKWAFKEEKPSPRHYQQ